MKLAADLLDVKPGLLDVKPDLLDVKPSADFKSFRPGQHTSLSLASLTYQTVLVVT